jgi:hypothetical protein
LFVVVGFVGVCLFSGDFWGYCEWERLNCCVGCRVEHGVVFEGSMLAVVVCPVFSVMLLFGCVLLFSLLLGVLSGGEEEAC